MKVRVIANNPDLSKGIEQDSIQSLIGKEYNVIDHDKEDNSVNVYEESFGGQITLNKGEYEII